MSTTYTAAATLALNTNFAITIPQDGDADSAASYTVGADKIADAVEFMRRRGRLAGNSIVTGDFSALTGWGAGAAVTAVAGTDSAGYVRITAGASGISANPSVLFTYHDGAWPAAPIIMTLCQPESGAVTAATGFGPTYTFGASNTTTISFVVIGTPTINIVYRLSWMVLAL